MTALTSDKLNDLLIEQQFNYITGVPDSIFKHFLIDANNDTRFKHVLSSNEGEACAIAAGYHLATGKVPVVYMQNSGFGNCINPLTSLLDDKIYGIPTLLLISWRGLPGEHDEPQHKRMGNVLPGMCSLLDINYAVATNDADHMQSLLQQAADHFKQHNKPFAILVPKGIITASESSQHTVATPDNALLREQLLEAIVDHSQPNDILITTTGKTSRELYEIREKRGQGHAQDFLTVGSMGCASSIALGIALEQPSRRVILVDGDGACLMRLEALATIGHEQPKNLMHIVIDNNAYESTGSQPTVSHVVDFAAVAQACSYAESYAMDDLASFQRHLTTWQQGPSMFIVNSFPYSRKNLGRPKTTPQQNKQAFMQHLGVCE
ncbi:MAG: phosphonopyruvate decarboxylase [Coxiellaceae bacterium]|nr:phosphonopyruvate decarboxylase [Coxiellaceae bacterium]